MEQHDNPIEAPHGGLALLQSVFASAGGLVAVLYAAGFVVVGTNLLDHGLLDPGLANARYVSVGACFMILLSLTLAPAAFSVYAAMRLGFRILDPRLSRGSIAQTVDWPGLIQGAFWVLLLLFALAVGLPVRVFLLIAQTGTGADALRYGENVPLYWSTLWRLLHYWFLPLFLCGMLIGQALGSGKVLRDFSERIGRYNTKKHNIIAPSRL